MITICQQCNKVFKGKGTKRKFCSIDCRIIAQKENNLINQYGSKLEREQRFKEEFESKFKNFIYYNGFKTIDENFICECKICGNKKEVNAQCLRAYSNLRCFACLADANKVREEVRKMIRANQTSLNKEVRALKKRMKAEVKHLKYLKICPECNKAFSENTKYCSNVCYKKTMNRKRHVKRESRRLNGDEISLETLIERDENICHICNNKCDKNDFIINNDKHFIVGKNYPSIDHVEPMSKGGSHTWNNVKLAHHYCNTLKNDKLFFSI
jgi:hypothetical protein